MELIPDVEFESYDDSICRLENNTRVLKMGVMCHNAYHGSLFTLRCRYFLSIETYGSSTSYFKRRERKSDNNYDVLLLSSGKFFEEDEFESLKAIASDISIRASKKVTFGYDFFIPVEERINGASLGLIVNSYNKGQLENDKPFIGVRGTIPDTLIIPLGAISKIHNHKVIVKHK